MKVGQKVTEEYVREEMTLSKRLYHFYVRLKITLYFLLLLLISTNCFSFLLL